MIGEIKDHELESLLCEPLEPVVDDGFSAVLAERLEKVARRRKMVLAVAFSFAALCFAAVLTPLLLTSISLVSGWQAAMIAFLAVSMPAASLFLVVDS